MSSVTPRSPRVSRRTLATGVGWSLPVVLIASPAPALAASGGALCPTCIQTRTVLNSGGMTISGSSVSGSVNLKLSLSGSACKGSTYPNGIDLNFTGATVTYDKPGGGSWDAVFAFGSGGTGVQNLVTGVATKTWTYSAAGSLGLTNAASIPQLATGSYIDQSRPTSVCWVGTYSVLVGTTTTTGNIKICASYCTWAANSNIWDQTTATERQISWNGTLCAGSATITCS